MIVLAGMIGIGKTTWTRELSNFLGTEAFYESVNDNPILDKFYEDPKKWGFSLQIYFLNKRFESIKQALNHNNNVLDRSIYEDLLFTKINVDEGNISPMDYEIYKNLLDNMMEELKGMPKKAPDVLIYLTGSFETVLQHIQKRGREYEQIDNNPELLEYYRKLYNSYDQWFKEYDKSPKIEVNVDNVDILDNPTWVCSELMKKIEKVKANE